MNKRNFIFIIILLITSSLWAQKFQYGNLYYEIIDETNKTVQVAYQEQKEISNSLIIPTTVIYANKEYRVTDIGEYAFFGCSELTSITIPKSVTNIGDSAFCKCLGLTSITIPESVTNIGNSAFLFCSSLTSITIPENVTRIEDYTFAFCSNLTSITIPKSVTSIGGWTFNFCSSLTSITIPENVTSIGSIAFSGCNQLKDILVKAATPPELPNHLGLNNNVLVYVPEESLKYYQESIWGNYNLKILPTSGIDNILINQSEEIYYDLQGRRVLHPTKGIYINQYGKKVLFE